MTQHPDALHLLGLIAHQRGQHLPWSRASRLTYRASPPCDHRRRAKQLDRVFKYM